MCERVLLPEGAGAGVANWLSPDGIHEALYPEIGGYYLQFLSLVGSATTSALSDSDTMTAPAARDAAARVVTWLHQAGPNGDPMTLYHGDPAQSDWRNRCLFAFDLGMIVRGFLSIEARWSGIVPAHLLARYVASLRSLIENGRLRSHRLRQGASEHEIPLKWSTRIDVHHVKIAAALCGAGTSFADIVPAILKEQGDALDREGSARMRELHPFLYLVEGWLMMWGRSGQRVFLDRAGTAFELVLHATGPEPSTLPPIAGRHDLPTRADVLAQALRAGLVLEAAGWFGAGGNSPWISARTRLQDALLSRVTPQGAIEFDAVGRHRNVWATLFAWQAVHFLIQTDTGSLNPRRAAASLI